MDPWVVVSTVSAAVAAVAALGGVYLAWKTLQESGDTIAELKKLQAAAQQEAEAARETTRALQLARRLLACERLLRSLPETWSG